MNVELNDMIKNCKFIASLLKIITLKFMCWIQTFTLTDLSIYHSTT